MARGKKKTTAIQTNEILNPQQIEFIKFYLDPKSETFGNAYQSALKVGYSDTYAQNITDLMPKWLSENIGDADMLNKAISNLKEFLNLEYKNDGNKLRVKFDATKFVAERLGKAKFGQEGSKTIIPIQVNFRDEDLQ